MTAKANTPHAYAANAGWVNSGPSSTARVSAGASFLQGFAYAANLGWIDFGDGSPANGSAYANNSAGDFGVNHDGTGKLSGYAYGANVGWINFSWAGAADPNRPRVDLLTGAAAGFAYGANVGWIDLSALTMPGVTAAIAFPSGNATQTAGNAVTLRVAVASGETLAMQWSFNGAAIAGATGTTYSLPSAQTFHAGDYAVQITRADNSVFQVAPATLAIAAAPANNARLLNLSTRAQCLTGDNVLIPGFVVTGVANKQLLIRAVGPKLAAFGVAGVLPDPQMVLKRFVSGSYLDFAANDNWGTSANAAAIVTTSADLLAFALDAGSLDSVLLLDVPPGQYTVVASGVGATTGIGIVEVYDADPAPAGSRLTNISNRGYVGTGGNIMIPGFVVSSEGSKRVLIRAVGPTLGSFGVAGTLADPTLTVFSGSTALFTNNDWSSDASVAATVSSVGAQVLAFSLDAGSKDAAIVLTLAPGAYTVQASGVGGTTGVALLEIYEAP